MGHTVTCINDVEVSFNIFLYVILLLDLNLISWYEFNIKKLSL